MLLEAARRGQAAAAKTPTLEVMAASWNQALLLQLADSAARRNSAGLVTERLPVDTGEFSMQSARPRSAQTRARSRSPREDLTSTQSPSPDDRPYGVERSRALTLDGPSRSDLRQYAKEGPDLRQYAAEEVRRYKLREMRQQKGYDPSQPAALSPRRPSTANNPEVRPGGRKGSGGWVGTAGRTSASMASLLSALMEAGERAENEQKDSLSPAGRMRRTLSYKPTVGECMEEADRLMRKLHGIKRAAVRDKERKEQLARYRAEEEAIRQAGGGAPPPIFPKNGGLPGGYVGGEGGIDGVLHHIERLEANKERQRLQERQRELELDRAREKAQQEEREQEAARAKLVGRQAVAVAVGDADMLKREGNVSEAVQVLVSALAYNPSAVALHTSLGRLLLERAEGAAAGAGALDDALQVIVRPVGPLPPPAPGVPPADAARALLHLKTARDLHVHRSNASNVSNVGRGAGAEEGRGGGASLREAAAREESDAAWRETTTWQQRLLMMPQGPPDALPQDRVEVSKLTVQIGRCYLLLNRVDLAVAAFKDALQSDANNTLAQVYHDRTVQALAGSNAAGCLSISGGSVSAEERRRLEELAYEREREKARADEREREAQRQREREREQDQERQRLQEERWERERALQSRLRAEAERIRDKEAAEEGESALEKLRELERQREMERQRTAELAALRERERQWQIEREIAEEKERLEEAHRAHARLRERQRMEAEVAREREHVQRERMMETQVKEDRARHQDADRAWQSLRESLRAPTGADSARKGEAVRTKGEPKAARTRPFPVDRHFQTEYSENYDVLGRLGKPQDVAHMPRKTAKPEDHRFY